MNTRFLFDSFLNALIERAVVKKREATREELEALISGLAPHTVFGAPSDAATLCEQPTGMEPVEDDGCIELPNNSLASSCTSMLIKAHGKSMTGAGIEEGDSLMVRITDKAHDGDKVVAFVDGELTCAVLVRKDNESGMLLPCNPDYKSIVLDGAYFGNIYIIGVITDIVPNVTDADTAAMCEQRQKHGQHSSVPSEAKVAKAVHQVIPYLKYNRHWFCVLRALLDCGYYKKLNYTAFVDDLCKWLGNKFPHKPDANDLADICYASFSKPFEEWEFEKSPFSKCKRRFDEYCEVVRKFQELLFA